MVGRLGNGRKMGLPEKQSGFLHWATGCQYPVNMSKLYNVETEYSDAKKIGMLHNGNWPFVHVAG